MTTTVYRAYDEGGRLLYVGIADNAFARFGTHAQGGAAWTAHVTTITLERYNDRETAAAAELSAIRNEDPVWNMRDRPLNRYMRWMIAYPDRAEFIEVDRQTTATIEAMTRKVWDRQAEECQRVAAMLKAGAVTVSQD
jgi:predicted GIY-YIG superfamily endonuclease